MLLIRTILSVFSSLLFIGCGAGELYHNEKDSIEVKINAKILHRGDGCLSSQEPYISLLISSQDAHDLNLSKPKLSLALSEDTAEKTAFDLALQSINYDDDYGVIVGLGFKATPGYSVFSVTSPIDVIEQVVTLGITIAEPQAGAILPQVVTIPCAVLSVNRGDYKKMIVSDQSGGFLQSVKISK